MHAQAGQRLDAAAGGTQRRRRRAGDDEPHVEAVFAAQVLHHLGQRVEHPGDTLEASLGHLQRGEQLAPAGIRGFIQRAEMHQRAAAKQATQPLDDLHLRAAEFGCDIGVRPLGQRKPVVQAAHEQHIARIEHLSLHRQPRRGVRRTGRTDAALSS